MTIKALVAALATMAHLGVMHRHDAILFHSLLETYPLIRTFHILQQQLTQELDRVRDLAPHGASGAQSPCAARTCAGNPVRAPSSAQSICTSPFDTGLQVPGIALLPGPSSHLPLLCISWRMTSASRL